MYYVSIYLNNILNKNNKVISRNKNRLDIEYSYFLQISSFLVFNLFNQKS